MKIRVAVQDIFFEWDSQKASANLRKHGVSFELACEAFFDPFVCYVSEEMIGDELRETIIGLSLKWHLIYVVYVMRADSIRIISARLVTNAERIVYENQ